MVLLIASCTSEPPDRSGFYNLFLRATLRDFAAERHYECQVEFELDVRVPLPDTFTTVADAHVRRAVVWNSGRHVAEDSIVRGVVIHLERQRREEFVPPFPDSVEITLTGAITSTLNAVGVGGGDPWYDGVGWSCDPSIPPQPTEALRQGGYPDVEIAPGEWHLFPYYAGD
jgi:hypothetical protein